jgi:hypothetical protein
MDWSLHGQDMVERRTAVKAVLVFHKRGEYLDQLSDYQSLKTDAAAGVSNSNSPAPEWILNKYRFKSNKCSRDKQSLHNGFP